MGRQYTASNFTGKKAKHDKLDLEFYGGKPQPFTLNLGFSNILKDEYLAFSTKTLDNKCK